MSDQIAFSFNHQYIIVLGGAKTENTEFPVINKNVHLLRLKPKKHSKK